MNVNDRAMLGLAKSLRNGLSDEVEGVITCISEDKGETVEVTLTSKSGAKTLTHAWDQLLPAAIEERFTPKKRQSKKNTKEA
ncbi:MAG: hypothetical protein JKX96_10770 [Acinetobacter sp.]|nr:hypothetical protein [Acinetobacter sp.]